MEISQTYAITINGISYSFSNLDPITGLLTEYENSSLEVLNLQRALERALENHGRIEAEIVARCN